MTPEARPCSTLRATKIPSPCSAARGIRRLKTEARQIETPNTTFEPYVSDSAPPVSGQQACPKFGGGPEMPKSRWEFGPKGEWKPILSAKH